MNHFADVRRFVRVLPSAFGLVSPPRACLILASIAAALGPGAVKDAAAQVAVAIEKYAGSGSVVEVGGAEFKYQDDAGKEFVVSVSPQRVYGGVNYSQLDPLQVRVRGAFEGERLEPGMFVAFPAVMVGRRVVEPVERLTIVTPGTSRPLGIHDPETLAADAVFGQFLGEPAAPVENPQSGEKPVPRPRDPRDRPVRKFVIGRIEKAPAPNRVMISAGEKVDVGATLADGALMFVDSNSATDLLAGDPIKLEGALIGEGSMFAVKIDVERPVAAEALEKPEGVVADAVPPANAPSGVKPPGEKRAGTPDKTAAKTPPEVKPPGDAAAPVAKPPAGVRGRVVEVN